MPSICLEWLVLECEGGKSHIKLAHDFKERDRRTRKQRLPSPSFLSKQILDHLFHAFMFLPANMNCSKGSKYAFWVVPAFKMCEAIISISHSVAVRSQLNKSVTLKISLKKQKPQTQQAQIFRDALYFYSSSKQQQKSVNSRWRLKGFQCGTISTERLERHHHHLFCEAKVAAKQSCALLLLNKWTIIAAHLSASVFFLSVHFSFS